jgi:hypothetical protein
MKGLEQPVAAQSNALALSDNIAPEGHNTYIYLMA